MPSEERVRDGRERTVAAAEKTEFAANFTFHWVTNGDLGNGLSLPRNFHLVIPAAFVSWGMFFALGVGNSVAALAKPATAGTAAFGGVLSTPFTFVALNIFASLLFGCLCGALSVRFAAVLTPKARATSSASSDRVAAA